jgi:sugar O-acyltransferase (sialic acid O-acetyltransferase NeuD family)
MSEPKYAIYSCEGFAREVLPSLRRQIAGGIDVVFVDDDVEKIGTVVNGCEVIGFEELCKSPHRDRIVSVSVADPGIRRKLVDRCRREDFQFAAIQDPTHIQLDNVSIGDGVILCANTVVTSDVSIGVHFHCNIYSYVAHDCRIGDFVTFAPRVSCNGRVVIEDGAYIGTGAVLKQGSHAKPLRIGRGAIVGMGAVVLKDVQDGEIVVGNPARPIRRKS